MICSRIGILLALLALLGGRAEALTIVLADDFDAENGGVGNLNYGPFANWEVGGAGVDLIGNGLFDFYPGNGLYVDLAFTFNGSITSRASFGPGEYRLSFALGNVSFAGNFVTVSLADFSMSFDSTVGMPLTPVSVDFVTTSSGNLAFVAGGPSDPGGSVIDRVLLTRLPEPHLVTLLLVPALPWLRRATRQP
jgi:hypothetical protein